MRSFLLILSLLIGSWALAQKRFSEGVISFQVETEVNGVKDDLSLNGVCFFKGAHYRSNLTSNRGTSSTIFDTREGMGAVFHEFGSQKVLIHLNRDQWTDKNRLLKNKELVFSFTGDTTHLLGYICQKAVALLEDSSQVEIMFTKEIVPENTDAEWQFQQLGGLVLLVKMVKKDATVVFKASALSFDPVPIQKFDIPNAGYRILEYGESKKWK
jgi:GLPGLI family protein